MPKKTIRETGSTRFRFGKLGTSVQVIADVVGFTFIRRRYQRLWIPNEDKLSVAYDVVAAMGILPKRRIESKSVLLPNIKDDGEASGEFGSG